MEGGAAGNFADGGHGAVSNVASGAMETGSGADERAIVILPVLAIFLISTADLFGADAILVLYFGWDVLLTVAVELAFSWVPARAAVRVTREGWVSVAARLT